MGRLTPASGELRAETDEDRREGVMFKHTALAVLALSAFLGCTADPNLRFVEGHTMASLPHLACVRGEHPKSCKKSSIETAKAYPGPTPTLSSTALPLARN